MIMPLNPDDYRHHFANFDLTREQETAMIEALITIAETVADLAWGVHPSQHPEVANDNDSLCDSNVIKFPSQSTHNQKPEERSAQARGQSARKRRP
jgi:hypothetical protein